MRTVQHRRNYRWAGASLAAAAVLAAACSGGSPHSSSSPRSGGGSISPGGSKATLSPWRISGAGESSAGSVYQQWANQYQGVNHRVRISFRPVGLGAGLSELSRGSVNFGAAEAPVLGSQLSAAQAAVHGPLLQVPVILGAVAVIYNVPGITHLVLNGPVLAAIYLGTIIRWNDHAIARLNPGVALPATPIQVIQRSDASGTSQVFTDYLARTTSSWTSQVGSGAAPAWPIGTSVTGSSGMAAAVRQATGAIGYVELGSARAMKIRYSALVNAAGRAVRPSAASVGAAATALAHRPGAGKLTFSLTGATAPAAYPLSAPGYVLVTQRQRNAAQGQALRAWLEWILQPAQQSGLTGQAWAPLPRALAVQVLRLVKTLQ